MWEASSASITASRVSLSFPKLPSAREVGILYIAGGVVSTAREAVRSAPVFGVLAGVRSPAWILGLD